MRKYIYIIVLLFVILSSLVSCSQTKEQNSNKSEVAFTEHMTSTITTNDSTMTDKKILFGTNATFEDGISSSVYITTDTSTSSEYFSNVYLYSNILSEEKSLYIGNFESKVLNYGKLVALDIDEDNSDELLLNMEISTNGGTISYVIDYIDDCFQLICDLEQVLPLFKSEINTNQMLKISVDAPKFEIELPKSYYMGDGNTDVEMPSTVWVWTDPIYNVSVTNGSTILCIAPLTIENSYCFDVRFYLKYDTISRSFFTDKVEFAQINSAR